MAQNKEKSGGEGGGEGGEKEERVDAAMKVV